MLYTETLARLILGLNGNPSVAFSHDGSLITGSLRQVREYLLNLPCGSVVECATDRYIKGDWMWHLDKCGCVV